MATIAENITIIQERAIELDALIDQFRTAKADIEKAEAEIRQLRPTSEPTRAHQERLSHVALDAMGKPSITQQKSIAELAIEAWEGVV